MSVNLTPRFGVRRWLVPSALGLLLTTQGCAFFGQLLHRSPRPEETAQPSPDGNLGPKGQRLIRVPARVYPLPGSLNEAPLFNSNSPEIIQKEGICLSTLAPRGPALAGVHLDYGFSGRFGVFSHHLAKDALFGRQLYVGLVVYNNGNRPALVKVRDANSYLTWPEAPFYQRPTLQEDPAGRLFAGPGDAVGTAVVHGASNLSTESLALMPHSARVLFSLPIPTLGEGSANGRSTLIHLSSRRRVRLVEVAAFASRDAKGEFVPPSLDDYRAVVARNVLAGPRDVPGSVYEPQGDVPQGFRYGRVCGVGLGERWSGQLFGPWPSAPQPALFQRAAFPIATSFLNLMGTNQNQAAPMLARYPDTAFQSHANYGITYEMTLPLANPTPKPTTFALTYDSPWQTVTTGPGSSIEYLKPPNHLVTFRGTLRLDWRDRTGLARVRFVHLVLHQGEQTQPFAYLVVPPQQRLDAKLSLVYPADATPPQLLTVQRLPLVTR